MKQNTGSYVSWTLKLQETDTQTVGKKKTKNLSKISIIHQTIRAINRESSQAIQSALYRNSLARYTRLKFPQYIEVIEAQKEIKPPVNEHS